MFGIQCYFYDKEYRDMQADEKFEWGTYRQDLRDFQLVSKRDNPTARAINEASGATKARGKLSEITIVGEDLFYPMDGTFVGALLMLPSRLYNDASLCNLHV